MAREQIEYIQCNPPVRAEEKSSRRPARKKVLGMKRPQVRRRILMGRVLKLLDQGQTREQMAETLGLPIEKIYPLARDALRLDLEESSERAAAIRERELAALEHLISRHMPEAERDAKTALIVSRLLARRTELVGGVPAQQVEHRHAHLHATIDARLTDDQLDQIRSSMMSLPLEVVRERRLAAQPAQKAEERIAAAQALVRVGEK